MLPKTSLLRESNAYCGAFIHCIPSKCCTCCTPRGDSLFRACPRYGAARIADTGEWLRMRRACLCRLYVRQMVRALVHSDSPKVPKVTRHISNVLGVEGTRSDYIVMSALLELWRPYKPKKEPIAGVSQQLRELISSFVHECARTGALSPSYPSQLPPDLPLVPQRASQFSIPEFIAGKVFPLCSEVPSGS